MGDGFDRLVDAVAKLGKKEALALVLTTGLVVGGIVWGYRDHEEKIKDQQVDRDLKRSEADKAQLSQQVVDLKAVAEARERDLAIEKAKSITLAGQIKELKDMELARASRPADEALFQELLSIKELKTGEKPSVGGNRFIISIENEYQNIPKAEDKTFTPFDPADKVNTRFVGMKFSINNTATKKTDRKESIKACLSNSRWTAEHIRSY